jgi:hypothetical protein
MASKRLSRVQIKCPKCGNTFLPSLKEKQSRAGASARRKGHSFERKIAKELEMWWPGNHEFKRTPMSGGSSLKEGWDLAGDICTTASDFIWHLELKNTPSQFTGLHNIFSDKSVFWRWLKQASNDCPDGKIPIIIFNRFDMPTFCASNHWNIIILVKNIDMNFMVYDKYGVCVWLYKDMLNSDPKLWGAKGELDE